MPAKRKSITLVESLPDEELEWMLMTEEDRHSEDERMWETYPALGGSLEPEPDPESPIYVL